jgi:hypothetical protein
MVAAISTFAAAAPFAQTGPGSNQPPGQATTTQSSEQKMDATDGKAMKKKASKKHAKKAKKSDM